MRTAIALNLMGAPKEAPVIVDTPPVVIPQTTLQLRLAGSFASPNKALAAALIDVDGNGSRYFRVGDAITGDVALYAVATDSITLKRKDGFEKLYFAGAAPTDAVQEAVAAVDQASGTIPRTPQPAVGTAAVTSAAVAVVTPSASAFLPGDLTLSERLTRLRAAQRQTQ